MLLVGSAATRLWFPEARPPSNINIWCPEREIQDLNVYECVDYCCGQTASRIHHAIEDEQNYLVESYDDRNAEMFEEANQDTPAISFQGRSVQIAKPSSLLSIKRAELYYPIKNWEKHMADYHFLKERVDPTDITEDEQVACSMRIKELEDRYRQYFNGATKSLMMKNEEFFGNYVKAFIRVYEHDDLHEATKYYERPLYEQLKDDTSLAYLPRKNFRRADYEDQIRLVREEAYAIALERVVIPSKEFKREYSPIEAVKFAVRRICTNLTRGWFRDFAIENYPEIINYDTDYVARFDAAVANGQIQRKLTRDWNHDDHQQVDEYFETYLDEWSYA